MEDGITPLLVASQNALTEDATTLIEAGASTNQAKNTGSIFPGRDLGILHGLPDRRATLPVTSSRF